MFKVPFDKVKGFVSKVFSRKKPEKEYLVIEDYRTTRRSSRHRPAQSVRPRRNR